MQAATIPPASTPRTDYASILRTYSTEQATAVLHIKPQTLRAGLCRDGHYGGVRPRKLPSRRLAWLASEIDRLAAGEAA